MLNISMAVYGSSDPSPLSTKRDFARELLEPVNTVNPSIVSSDVLLHKGPTESADDSKNASQRFFPCDTIFTAALVNLTSHMSHSLY